MDGQESIIVCIGKRSKKMFGYASFIEWHRTSFYIKSQYLPLQTMKVSIHGTDPRPQHLGKQHFRLDVERDHLVQAALDAGGGWGADPGQYLPLDFVGREIDEHTLHIVRFSADWTMFVKGVPSAPIPQLQPGVTLHAVGPAPPPGQVTHVDLYLSTGEPYWPDEQLARARNAGFGPIVNSAGMKLTAVVAKRSTQFEQDPLGDLVGDAPFEDCVRGIAAKVDDTGLLWMCEKMMPRTRLGSARPVRGRRDKSHQG
ncbi:hypothetical protein A5686_12330 [Mycobacterium sp. E2479]|nr:hypothetical protein A5686_12330 [Mycobacterium sp. E2479]